MNLEELNRLKRQKAIDICVVHMQAYRTADMDYEAAKLDLEDWYQKELKKLEA